jgi:hypothetical protein
MHGPLEQVWHGLFVLWDSKAKDTLKVSRNVQLCTIHHEQYAIVHVYFEGSNTDGVCSDDSLNCAAAKGH